MTPENALKNKNKAYLILVLMSLYVLWPIDFLPDLIPGGNLDDLLVMLFSTKKAFPLLEAAA